MIEVSKERFYSLIYEKKLNVHPRPEADKTYWEMQDGSRKLFGISTPGYKEPDAAKTYKVSPDFEGGQ